METEYCITLERFDEFSGKDEKVYLGTCGWGRDRRDALAFSEDQADAIYFALQDGRTGNSLDYEPVG